MSYIAHVQLGQLTLSGSSTLTLRPGLARSGRTHSLLGFANTLPELDEVSLLLPAMGCGSAAGVLRGVDDEAVEDGRRTTGGGAVVVGFALRPGGGLAASAGVEDVDEDDVDADGRGIMTGRLDWVGIAMRGWSDGGGRAATDMPSQSRSGGGRDGFVRC